MKQVTGKINSPEIRNKVSIQLKLGGHSFSVDTLSTEASNQAGETEFVLLTAKTLLLPREEFEPSLAGAYLRLAGMTCSPEEIPVWSAPEAPIVAVMAADQTCITTLRSRLGARAAFNSPLLFAQHFTAPTIWFYRAEQLLYIKVYDSALRFAEVVPVTTEADLTYYVERLSEEFLFSSFTACCAGEERKETSKLLRSYFPRIRCE